MLILSKREAISDEEKPRTDADSSSQGQSNGNDKNKSAPEEPPPHGKYNSKLDSKIPFGYSSLEEFRDVHLTKDVQIIYQVFAKIACEIVLKKIEIANIDPTDNAKIASEIKDLTLNMVVNYIDSEVDIKNTLTDTRMNWNLIDDVRNRGE